MQAEREILMIIGATSSWYSYNIVDANELEKDDKKLQNVMLKQRNADKVLNGKEMKKKIELWEKQLTEDKVKSQRHIDREVERIAIESIKRMVDFDDNMQAVR
ncbi:hypothetical protein A4A49_54275 [Nicotiana attenuata]|uniref:Uncharacterized protein n=1 Tax=Nicotiana attenuata TaxID=49451 RepID=A0A1J6ISQ6_NICAT|nr:hypothetical protein A4A49_54275 [Nicotiana attenuata]